MFHDGKTPGSTKTVVKVAELVVVVIGWMQNKLNKTYSNKLFIIYLSYALKLIGQLNHTIRTVGEIKIIS